MTKLGKCFKGHEGALKVKVYKGRLLTVGIKHFAKFSELVFVFQLIFKFQFVHSIQL